MLFGVYIACVILLSGFCHWFSIQYGSLVVSCYKQAMKETKYKLKLLAAIIYVGTYVYLLYFVLIRIQST
jgi:hypothetical protein